VTRPSPSIVSVGRMDVLHGGERKAESFRRSTSAPRRQCIARTDQIASTREVDSCCVCVVSATRCAMPRHLKVSGTISTRPRIRECERTLSCHTPAAVPAYSPIRMQASSEHDRADRPCLGMGRRLRRIRGNDQKRQEKSLRASCALLGPKSDLRQQRCARPAPRMVQ